MIPADPQPSLLHTQTVESSSIYPKNDYSELRIQPMAFHISNTLDFVSSKVFFIPGFSATTVPKP